MFDLTPRQPHRPLLWPDVVLDVADLLADAPNPVYIVGGAVRDALLHRPLQDLDLAVQTHAVELARRFANRLHGDFYVLDAERDVGRVLLNTPAGRMTFDIARFRGDDLLADLLDRDFTLNAMAVNLGGDLSQLIDPSGGERDIQAKTIRRCSPGVIADDPIRVLRAVRQSVQLGFRIEAETLREAREYASHLADISPERVRDEFMKMLALPRSAAALRVADVIGALQWVVPEIALLRELKQKNISDTWSHTLQVVEILSNLLTAVGPARTDSTVAAFGLGMLVMQLDRYRSHLLEHIAIEWPNERSHRALLTLAALLHDSGKAATKNAAGDVKAMLRLADERLQGLHLSNDERNRLLTALRHMAWFTSGEPATPLALHRYWRQAGAAGVDALLLAVCDYLAEWGGAINQDFWLHLVERARIMLEAYYDHYEQIVNPVPLLDGIQLMNALDLKPGRMIGRLLEHIREAQVMGEVNSLDDALMVARAYLVENR